MSNETPDVARLDALGFVEQTMYANEDSSPSLTWRNDEVMSLLAEIAERLRVEVETHDDDDDDQAEVYERDPDGGLWCAGCKTRDNEPCRISYCDDASREAAEAPDHENRSE